MRPTGYYWIKWTATTYWEIAYWSQSKVSNIGWHWSLTGSESFIKTVFEIDETPIIRDKQL